MHLNPKILRDPQFNLSSKDQRHLMRRASTQWFKQPLNIAIYLVIVLGWMVSMIFLPKWLESQGLSSPASILINWLIFYPFMFVAFYYVFYHFRLLTHVYHELRALGHDVCPKCGYTLINLPETEIKCPECGTLRTKPNQAPIVPSD